MAPNRLPRKQRLQVRARTIEYVVSGRGAPTLLLFSGAGVTLEGWGKLFPGLDRVGRVLAWNRPGVGRSSGPHVPQNGAVVVDAARSLAAAVGAAHRTCWSGIRSAGCTRSSSPSGIRTRWPAWCWWSHCMSRIAGW